MNAERLMMIGGAGAFGLTFYWVRSRELTERHALAWMAVATLILICGDFPSVLEGGAVAMHLSYPAAVLFLSLGIIYVFAFSISLALSRQHRRGLRLIQHIALLEGRIRELEASRSNPASPGPASAPQE